MVGCCGQKSNVQYNDRDKKDKCAPITTNSANIRCVPGATTGNNRGSPHLGQHDEEVCHGTGERRRDLLDQLKIFLGEFDDRPCSVTPPQQGADTLRTLGSYPEYLKKHCQSWMPPNPRPPLITSVQTHEIRASSDYEKAKAETSEYLSFIDATPKPPVETCDCVKRNGLQDQCPHPMCKPPTAKCKANNPGPCCPPSLGLGGPSAVLGGGVTTGPHGTTETQGNSGRTEYQEAFAHCSPPQQMQAHSPVPSFTTTYRHDFQNQQGHQQQKLMMHQNPQLPFVVVNHPKGAAVPQPPPGMEMICICEAPSSALPSGKKYLCCPVRY